MCKVEESRRARDTFITEMCISVLDRNVERKKKRASS